MKTALVLMAAGLGSRYGGNKQIDGLGPNNEILMDYAVYDGVRAGFNKIVFIIKTDIVDTVMKLCGEKISELMDRNGEPVEIEYVFQDRAYLPPWFKMPIGRTKPLGTVQAVLAANDVVKEPFAVINADDYYGYSALKALHDGLLTLPKKGEGLMIGYRLKNTVSRNAAVNRGICCAAKGVLESVTETYNIRVLPDGSLCDGNSTPLDPDSAVSMNIWGFTPTVFEDMQEYFDGFLHGLGETELKRECILPDMADSFIKNGKLKIRVLDTDSVWFGVTYREDRESVMCELKKLHEFGVYPCRLW